MLIVLFFYTALTLECAAISLAKVIGTGKIIKNGVSEFVGRTEVIPAYALHAWKYAYWGYYGNAPFKVIKAVNRLPYTGDYLYQTMIYDPDSGYFDYYYGKFPLNQIRRFNYRCDVSTDSNQFIFNEIENFVIGVWVDSLKKSGYMPPGDPYTAWLKTYGTKLGENCEERPVGGRYFRSDTQIRDTGMSYIQPGWVGYSYDWPMLCWIGDAYNY